MRFTEIVAPTIKDLFVSKLEDLILSGELPIGTRLPSERELAEQMKISKTAVHSGITEMTRKGFLEVVPRKGVFVGDYAQRGTLEALTSIMQHNGGRLDARNVQSLLEMRFAIEGVAIRRVIEAHDPKVFAALTAMSEEAEGLIADEERVDYNALAELYFRFHHYICVASGNTIAPLIFNAFRIPSLQFWATSARTLGCRESVDRLVKFAVCITNRDAEGACGHLADITENSAVISKPENGGVTRASSPYSPYPNETSPAK